MKSYKEYYQFGLNEHLDWKSKQEEEWWRRNELKGKLNLEGDYIETINVLSEYEKNDSSLFTNHTNVKNSEWGILFSMLGQALVDWCRENTDWKNLWSAGISINKEMEGCSPSYICSFYVNNYDFVNRSRVEIVGEELEKYDGLGDFLYDLVDWFFTREGNNIPNDWNRFCFGLDSLMDSCEYGEWVCASDGYMNLANFVDGEDGGWTDFVECM